LEQTDIIIQEQAKIFSNACAIIYLDVVKEQKKRPLKLVYMEECATYTDALKREQFLKSGTGRRSLSQQTVSP